MTYGKDWAELIVWFCLAVAETSAPRTIYHSRIDGLILPACEPPSPFHETF